MKDFKNKYKKHFGNRQFVMSVLIGIGLLLLSFVVNFYAGTYATEKASNHVNDIILSNIPVYDVDFTFIYGPLFIWFFVATLCIHEPKKIPFVLKSIALFIFIRSIFITLTHIGPFPDQIVFSNDSTDWINNFAFGGDLFFSAHTGLPFLMALVFGKNLLLKIIFTVSAVFFGIVVLLGHLHYSIDVISAFFITYTIFHIAEKLFKKDREMFLSTPTDPTDLL